MLVCLVAFDFGFMVWFLLFDLLFGGLDFGVLCLALLGVIIFSILGFCMHIAHYYFEFISLVGLGLVSVGCFLCLDWCLGGLCGRFIGLFIECLVVCIELGLLLVCCSVLLSLLLYFVLLL